MAMTDLEWVRAFSTSDTDTLSDEQITAFLDEHSGETETSDQRKLALADCCEFLSRDDVYESYSRGGISAGRNRLIQKAEDLRAEVGITVGTGTLILAGYEDD